jgi:hypothetical protein
MLKKRGNSGWGMVLVEDGSEMDLDSKSDMIERHIELGTGSTHILLQTGESELSLWHPGGDVKLLGIQIHSTGERPAYMRVMDGI